MSVERFNSDDIKQFLTEEFQTSDSETKYLLRLVQVNIHDLGVEMEEAVEKLDWNRLAYLNRKINAIAVNLRWEVMQQFTHFMEQTITERNDRYLEPLTAKLATIAHEAASLAVSRSTVEELERPGKAVRPA